MMELRWIHILAQYCLTVISTHVQICHVTI